ncbi:RNA polymerase sigma factor [Roseovarius aestuarii]|nr:RNA polymerase sigma factor [Roseovarius aestuarii]
MTCPRLASETLTALHPDLMRLARRLANSESEAQDLAQETILRLWRRRYELNEIDDLRAYARTAMRNLFRQGLRHAPFQTLEHAPEPTEGPAVFGALALRDVAGAITRLPDDQSRLIRLVADGETSPAALARLTGCQVGTVMSRLARARAQLRRDIGLGAATPVNDLL